MATQLDIEKFPARSGSKEQTALVKKDGEVVGFMRKFKADRSTKTPWQVFLMDGVHPQTGDPCVGTLVASEYGRFAITRCRAALEARLGLI